MPSDSGVSADTCVSIHALMKRATSSSRKMPTLRQVSIHALMKRATERHAGGVITDKVSIHALMKRAT